MITKLQSYPLITNVISHALPTKATMLKMYRFLYNVDRIVLYIICIYILSNCVTLRNSISYEQKNKTNINFSKFMYPSIWIIFVSLNFMIFFLSLKLFLTRGTRRMMLGGGYIFVQTCIIMAWQNLQHHYVPIRFFSDWSSWLFHNAPLSNSKIVLA